MPGAGRGENTRERGADILQFQSTISISMFCYLTNRFSPFASHYDNSFFVNFFFFSQKEERGECDASGGNVFFLKGNMDIIWNLNY